MRGWGGGESETVEGLGVEVGLYGDSGWFTGDLLRDPPGVRRVWAVRVRLE